MGEEVSLHRRDRRINSSHLRIKVLYLCTNKEHAYKQDNSWYELTPHDYSSSFLSFKKSICLYASASAKRNR